MPDELSVRCGGEFQLEQFSLFVLYISLLGKVSLNAKVLLLKRLKTTDFSSPLLMSVETFINWKFITTRMSSFHLFITPLQSCFSLFFTLKCVPPSFFHTVILLWGYIEPTQFVHKQALQILIMANMPSILRILNPNPEYVPEYQGVKLSVQLYTICTFHKHQFFCLYSGDL